MSDEYKKNIYYIDKNIYNIDKNIKIIKNNNFNNYYKYDLEYDINKKIDKNYYYFQTPQEQLNIIRTYAIALSQKQNKPKSDISQSDLLLIKKIFDFSGCRTELLDNSFEIIEFFRLCEVDLSAFLSYGVNTSTYEDTWGDMLLKILKQDDTKEFISTVWTYYREKYFSPKNKNQRVTSFINF